MQFLHTLHTFFIVVSLSTSLLRCFWMLRCVYNILIYRYQIIELSPRLLLLSRSLQHRYKSRYICGFCFVVSSASASSTYLIISAHFAQLKCNSIAECFLFSCLAPFSSSQGAHNTNTHTHTRSGRVTRITSKQAGDRQKLLLLLLLPVCGSTPAAFEAITICSSAYFDNSMQ